MTSEALVYKDPPPLEFTAPVALTSGEVFQLPDGRAAVVAGLAGFAAGDWACAYVQGIYSVQKTASIALLKGGKVYWDRSANKAHFRPQSGDFFLGTVVADAAGTDTTVDVDINVVPQYAINLDGAPSGTRWTEAITGAGQGLVTEATMVQYTTLSCDNGDEVAMAAIYPTDVRDHIPVADGPIFEARVAIPDIGDDGQLNINVGLANGTHATDADAITESVFIHFDGSALDILAESDDGTTEVAATDTTIDALADNTIFEIWIDCRDLTDIQIYIDGVNVLPASVFKLNAATGPVFPIAHIEKTGSTTTCEVWIEWMRVRTCD